MKWKAIVGLFGLGLALLMGCSGKEESEGTGSQDLTEAAEEGEICGGFVGTRCAEGLRCTYGSIGLGTGRCERGAESDGDGDADAGADSTGADASSDPGYLDGADEGEVCGGFAGTRCRPGLTCDNSLGLGTGRCR